MQLQPDGGDMGRESEQGKSEKLPDEAKPSLLGELRTRRQLYSDRVSRLDRAIALLEADPSLEHSFEIIAAAKRGI